MTKSYEQINLLRLGIKSNQISALSEVNQDILTSIEKLVVGDNQYSIGVIKHEIARLIPQLHETTFIVKEFAEAMTELIDEIEEKQPYSTSVEE